MSEHKLIIVDDEELERRGLASFIPYEELNIRVVGTAQNGREGLELLANTLPDIAITDVKMPIMDGLEMIRIAREKGYSTHFVILSGYGDYDFTSKAMEMGVRHYILKPCDDKRVIETLGKVLEELHIDRQRKEELEEASQVRSLLDEDLLETAHDARARSSDAMRAELAQRVFDDLLIECTAGATFVDVCQSCLVANLKLKLLHYSLEDRAMLFNWILGESIPGMRIGDPRFIVEDGQLLRLVIGVVANGLLDSGARCPEGDERILRELFLNITTQGLTANWLAKNVFFMSPDHFGRRLRSITGSKFNRFVNMMRVDAACKLIELCPGERLSTIATLVGFASDEQHFSRTFKRIVGVCPRDYAARFARA